MSRLQLALNVDDVDAAVAFYSKLFDTQPAKRRPGYANFAVDDPALKLVLIEKAGHGGTLNHLGVEVGSTDEVTDATRRLADGGLVTEVEKEAACCYAVQDKVWVSGPGGEQWEVYTVLADDRPELEGATEGADLRGDGTCCGTEQEPALACC